MHGAAGGLTEAALATQLQVNISKKVRLFTGSTCSIYLHPHADPYLTAMLMAGARTDGCHEAAAATA